MNKLIRERAKNIKKIKPIGSYKSKDCIFLLKNLNGCMSEQSNEERESKIQLGEAHYSEMLPVEYKPTDEYIEIFHKILNESSKQLAEYVGVVSETIISERGFEGLILCSLARAGSPIGVLIKRYILEKYNIDIPHYSISIIRDKGFDENALCYIIDKHNTENIIFIDGWTGKGIISLQLIESCSEFNKKYNVDLNPELAVLADPAQCSPIFGTREDLLIPSACLNSTVSGLTTRSVQRDDLIGMYEFHGAKYYEDWKDIDLSNYYIDEISKHFVDLNLKGDFKKEPEIPHFGMKEVKRIMEKYNVEDVNLCKISIGETFRVALRRKCKMIIVKDINSPKTQLLKMLAKDRGIPVVEDTDMIYQACGIIENLKNSL